MEGFFTKKQTESKTRPDGKVHSCFSCGLLTLCKSPKMSPTGNFKLGILNIGEAPDTTDDRLGLPFRSKAGRYLQKMYRQVGIDLEEDCLNVNAIKCSPQTKEGKNRKPTNYEIDCCRKYVLEVIEKYNPKVIVLFGASPLYSVLKGHYSKDLGDIHKWQGWTIPDQKYKAWLLPVYAPDFILHQESQESEVVWLQSLKQVKIKAREEFPIYEEPKIEIIEDLSVLETIKSSEIAFDYETTGLKPHAPEHRIVCAAVAHSENHAYVFRMPRKKSERTPFINLLQDPVIKKMAHNMKFEDHWTNVKLKTEITNWYWDSMLVAHVLDNRPGITGLKFQTYINFGIADYDSEISPYLKSEGNNDNAVNNIFKAIENGYEEKLLKYCALDAIYQYRLYKYQEKQIRSVQRLYDAYMLMHNGILAIAKAERQGFRIDVEYIQKKKEFLSRKIEKIETQFKESDLYKEWQKHSKGQVNINSGKQLGDFLYGIKKLKPTKTTTSGLGSTDEEALLSLNLPELTRLLETKKLKKIRDTYLDAFDREQVNGIIHPFFNLHLVQTYRSSSNSPNFQNIPKRDKEAMKAVRKAIYPRPGHQLLEVDFSGIEVRIAACYHKDPTMLKYINDPTTDMHRDMAEQIFKINNFNKALPEHSYLRSAAKNGFVFPQFYGDYYKNCAENLAIRWGGLSEGKWKAGQGVVFEGKNLADHLLKQGIRSLEQFTEHIRLIENDFWSNRFPKYSWWKDATYATYKKYGYFTLKTGFDCKGIMRKNEVINYPVQGAAFHCLLWSFTEMVNALEKKCMDSKVIGQIHDSIVLDVHPEELEEVKKLLRYITTIALPKHWDWIIVPMDIDAEISPVDGSWADKQDCKI